MGNSKLRLTIEANADQGIKNIENFKNHVDNTYQSISQLGNKLSKLEYFDKLKESTKGNAEELAKIEKKIKSVGSTSVDLQKNIKLALQKEINSLTVNGGFQADIYEKQIKKIQAIIQSLSTKTTDSNFLYELKNISDDLKEKLNIVLEQEKEINAEIAKRNNLISTGKKEFEKTYALAKQQAADYKQQLDIFSETWGKAKKQNVDYLKATALGNQGVILGQQYSLLDAELEKLLITEGKITPKTQELANKMKALEKEMNKASKTPINERMANLVKSFVSAQAVVWAISKTFRTIINLFKESAEAASKAEETANLFNTTFGNIQSTANNVSLNLSTSLGMANSTIQQSIGLFGDLAMGYGQTQDAALKFAESAVQTGLDIISFKNISGDTTEVLQTMASGLAGNFENFRKWGIIVTQAEVKTRLQQKGLDKLTGSSLQFAKVQETLAIVQEKSKNAQGDMVKTLDSTENITRRLNEANKQLLENMGVGVNKVLNPVKKLWISIAEEINKANLAQELYKQGQKDINVYDIKNNAKDYDNFKKNIMAVKWNITADKIFNTPKEETNSWAQTELSKIMVTFGASIDDVIKVAEELKFEIDSNIIESLKSFDEQLRKDIEDSKALEKRTNYVSNYASSAQNYIDSLSNITGVKLTRPYQTNIKTYTSLDNTDKIDSNVKSAIDEAIRSLSKADWTEFSNTIGVALGDVTEASGLEEKLKSIYSLYESVYNLRLEDGKLTEEEKEELQKIADLYKNINDRVQSISSFNSIKDSFTSGNQSLQNELSDLKKTDLEKSIAEVERQFASIDFSKLSDSEQELLKTLYNERITLLKKIDAEKQLIKVEEEYADKLQDYKDRILEFRQTNATLGMTDEEKEIYSLTQEREAALAAVGTDTNKARDIVNYFKEMISLVKDKYEYEKTQNLKEATTSFNDYLNNLRGDTGYTSYRQLTDRKAFENKITEYFKDIILTENSKEVYYNEFLRIIKEQKKNEAKATINSGLGESLDMYKGLETLFTGGGIGDLLVMLAKLVAQTEVFAKLGSLLSDHVVPVLDALLRPLLPVIEMIGQSIAGIVEFFSAILYPLINEVSQALALVFGTIKSVIDFIVDGAKWVIGQIYMFFQNFINGVISMLNSIPFVNIGYLRGGAVEDWSRIDAVKNFENNMAEVLKAVQDIRDTNMDIADNTSEKKSESLKTIEDLYKRGILTSSQRDAEIASLAGKHYDATKLFNGGAYRSTGYETTISYGDINITVNGSNANAADIAKEVKKVLEGQQRAGRNLISA